MNDNDAVRIGALEAEVDYLRQQNADATRTVAELLEVIGQELGWSWADLDDARRRARRTLARVAADHPVKHPLTVAAHVPTEGKDDRR